MLIETGKPTLGLLPHSHFLRLIRGGARPRLVDAAAKELGRVLDARENDTEHDQRQTDAQRGRRLVEFGRRLDRLQDLRCDNQGKRRKMTHTCICFRERTKMANARKRAFGSRPNTQYRKTYVKLVENNREEDEAGNQNRKVERISNDTGRRRRRDDGKQHDDGGRPQIPILRLNS